MMNLPSEHHQSQQPRISLTPSTGVSIGLMVLIIAGVLWIGNTLGAIKTEIGSAQAQNAANKQELLAKIEKVETKVIALETNKEGVTKFDFLRWAVHLQQLNNDVKKLQLEGLKVPELDTR
jgi:hypothetical protein